MVAARDLSSHRTPFMDWSQPQDDVGYCTEAPGKPGASLRSCTMDVMPRRLLTPLTLTSKMRSTAWAFIVVHALLGIGLFYVWGNGEEQLPVPWLWWLFHVAATGMILGFLRYPTRGTRAGAGAVSTVCFSGRSAAYAWVLIMDRSNPMVDQLGSRFYMGVVAWLAMAVMGEFLWWWMSGYRTLRED